MLRKSDMLKVGILNAGSPAFKAYEHDNISDKKNEAIAQAAQRSQHSLLSIVEGIDDEQAVGKLDVLAQCNTRRQDGQERINRVPVMTSSIEHSS